MANTRRRSGAKVVDPKTQRAAEYLALPYSRILIPQDEGQFAAQILEFPGCLAVGGSAAEAYANLEEVALSWLLGCMSNGTPVPPPITNYEASGKFALRLPKSLYSRVSIAAAQEGVSVNQYITAAVAERLGGSAVADALKRAAAEIRRLAFVQFQRFAETDSGTRQGGFGNYSDTADTTGLQHGLN